MKQILSALLVVASTSCAIGQVPSYVPTNGLVGWWPFNGNANDESGNANHGTPYGPILTTDRNNVADNAYAFNRSAVQTIDVSQSPTLNGCPALTISLWTILNSYAANGQAGYNHFVNKSPGGSDYQYALANNTTGLYFYYGSGGAYFQTSTLPSLNAWHHLALTYTYDGTPTNSWCRFYVDGACTDSFPTTTVLQPTTHPLRFGSFPGGTYNTVDGKVDDLGIWNRMLTANEVSGLFSETPVSPCISSTPVSFIGLNTSYTINDGPSTLVGTPSGGVFIGLGVSGNSFDPAVAGIGIHSITYTYLDGTNCVNTAGFCTEVAQNVGMGGAAMIAGRVHVFPNPNRGVFTVELELDGLVSMRVTDAVGRLMHSEVFHASGGRTARTLDLSMLAKGHYTLQVHNAGGVIEQGIVLE
ncbi:MAG: LamG-like jellyroll fold domain-containing protein [Flavobacteriales bacterium]